MTDCGPLNNPSNGFVNFLSSTFLSVAQYTCTQGFQLMGDTERECMANGAWSGEEPICSGKYTHISRNIIGEGLSSLYWCTQITKSLFSNQL